MRGTYRDTYERHKRWKRTRGMYEGHVREKHTRETWTVRKRGLGDDAEAVGARLTADASSMDRLSMASSRSGRFWCERGKARKGKGKL